MLFWIIRDSYLLLVAGEPRKTRERVKEIKSENARLRAQLETMGAEIEANGEWRHAVTSDIHDGKVIWWRTVRLHFQNCWKNL